MVLDAVMDNHGNKEGMSGGWEAWAIRELCTLTFPDVGS